MQTWALIVDCFREAIDRKIFWVMIAISGCIAAAMACVGFGDNQISFLFGVWTIETTDYAAGSGMARALVGSLLVKYIADVYIGWAGIIMALVATAGIFPSLMERGTVDVVLAKPLSRAKLFLAKYAGSMVFVAAQAAIFVVLTFLVVGLRWQQWFWGYLWFIPLIIVLFSYLYAFVALFAVTTRSTMTALLLGMVAWVMIWIPQAAYNVLVAVSTPSVAQHGSDSDTPVIDEKWVRAARAVRAVFPKTQDIPLIAGNLIGASTVAEVLVGSDSSEMPAATREQMDAQVAVEHILSNVDAFKSIASSLLFEAVVVLLALWRFSRQDF